MKYKLLLFLFCISCSFVHAQSDTGKTQPFSMNVDFASSFIWRGTEVSRVPSIQPYFSFEKKGFEIGAWSTCAVNGTYSEADLYLKYNLGNFSATVTDYYTPPDSVSWRYFNYRNNETPHTYEGTISFEGTEKIPLKVSANVFFYGNDLDSDQKQMYSTYFEAEYALKKMDLFCGFTPGNSFYYDKAAIVNAGFRLNRTLIVTKKISLPCSISLITNPAEQKIFVVASITL
jgi:hypothetical protein